MDINDDIFTQVILLHTWQVVTLVLIHNRVRNMCENIFCINISMTTGCRFSCELGIFFIDIDLHNVRHLWRLIFFFFFVQKDFFR